MRKSEKSLKTLTTEIKDSQNLKRSTSLQFEVLRLQKFTDEKQDSEQIRILNNIEHHIKELELKRYELNFKIQELENGVEWIDWVSEFRKNLKKLSDSTLEEKHQLLSKIIEDITVFTIDKRKHKLIINFRLPYVDDELVWNNPSDKSLGYIISNGQKNMELELFDEKKYQKNQ